MDWFNNLLNSASSFAATPAGQNLIYPGSAGARANPVTPTAAAPAVSSKLPTWLWIALGGGVLVLVVWLVAKD